MTTIWFNERISGTFSPPKEGEGEAAVRPELRLRGHYFSRHGRKQQ